ncbi:hypothetical protein GGF43_005834 [Coemansia sp. RSA 2618]|nr:hypothetical protein GGF43_005834 [Coemansia sp. RSA 2618]
MADSNDVGDIHGFFQFASDSDSDSNGLFGETRDRKKGFDVRQINYTPDIDSDAWFDRTTTNTTIAEWSKEHYGFDQITFTVQRLYFKREFAQCADICKQAVCAYLTRGFKNERIASVREILDMGIRSAIRASDVEAVRWFYDWYAQCGGMNPGYNMVKAQALNAMRRWEAALEQLILYLEQRRQDAVVWEDIGLALISLAQDHNTNACLRVPLLRLALGSFCRAFSIIHGCKNWKSMEAAVRRKHVQTERLWANAVRTARMLDIPVGAGDSKQEECPKLNAESEQEWLKLSAEAEVDQAWPASMLDQCSEPLKSSVAWISLNLSTGPQGGDAANDADDEEKNVSEL